MGNRYYDPLETMHVNAFLRAAGIGVYDKIPGETCHLVCIEQNAFITVFQCDKCFHEIEVKSDDVNTINHVRCPNCGAKVVE